MPLELPKPLMTQRSSALNQTDGETTGPGETDGEVTGLGNNQPGEEKPLELSHGAEPGVVRSLEPSHGVLPGLEAPSELSQPGAVPGEVRSLELSHGELPGVLLDQPVRELSELTGTVTVSLTLETDGEDSVLRFSLTDGNQLGVLTKLGVHQPLEEPGILHGEVTDGELTPSQLERYHQEKVGLTPTGTQPILTEEMSGLPLLLKADGTPLGTDHGTPGESPVDQ